jgi:hypothetical protein
MADRSSAARFPAAFTASLRFGASPVAESATTARTIRHRSGSCSSAFSRSSTMPMRVRHPEAADSVALEIKFDHHDGFVANDPAIVTRIDRDNLRRLVLDNAAVRVLDMNLALHQETHVRVHAELGADERFHVD